MPVRADVVDPNEIRAGEGAEEADGPVLEVPDRSEAPDFTLPRARFRAGTREFLVGRDERTPPDNMVLFLMLDELRFRMLAGLRGGAPRQD